MSQIKNIRSLGVVLGVAFSIVGAPSISHAKPTDGSDESVGPGDGPTGSKPLVELTPEEKIAKLCTAKNSVCVTPEGKRFPQSPAPIDGRTGEVLTVYVITGPGKPPPANLKATGQGVSTVTSGGDKSGYSMFKLKVPDSPVAVVELSAEADGRHVAGKVVVNNPLAVQERALFKEYRCTDATVLCLDVRTGDTFRADEVPSLRADEKLIVHAFGPPDHEVEGAWKISLKASQIRNLETLFRSATSGAKVTGESEGKPEIVLRESVAASPSDDSDRVVVEMSVLAPKKPERVYSTSVQVLRGRYFLDVGVAIALVSNGSREVVASPVAGTGERVASVRETARLDGALMLNAFVFGGRRSGKVWFASHNKEWYKDLFGVQVGVNLNLKDPFQQIYLGLLAEPIAGLSIGGGLAVVQGGKFLENASDEGAIVGRGTEPAQISKVIVRPYMALTFSTDILSTAKSVYSAAKGLQSE